MHPLQGLKRLLLGALLTATTSTGALAAEKFRSSPPLPSSRIWRKRGGDAAEVTSITKPGAEIHEYQPTPGISSARKRRS